MPEGAGTVLDNTLLVFVHEHAEAGPHKAVGHVNLIAGLGNKINHGQHMRVTGSVGDMYMTLIDGPLGAGVGRYPAATGKLPQLLA
jgi:hypothetical protein